MTLLRMKLHAEDIPSLKSSHELSSVICHRNHVFPLMAHHPVGMYEVKTLFLGSEGDQRVIPANLQRIPPHVRNPQTSCRILSKAQDNGVHPAKPWKLPLFARLAEYLHAQTNTNQGNLPLQGSGLKRLAPAAGIQRLHPVIERPHAGKNDLIRSQQFFRVMRDGT